MECPCRSAVRSGWAVWRESSASAVRSADRSSPVFASVRVGLAHPAGSPRPGAARQRGDRRGFATRRDDDHRRRHRGGCVPAAWMRSAHVPLERCARSTEPSGWRSSGWVRWCSPTASIDSTSHRNGSSWRPVGVTRIGTSPILTQRSRAVWLTPSKRAATARVTVGPAIRSRLARTAAMSPRAVTDVRSARRSLATSPIKRSFRAIALTAAFYIMLRVFPIFFNMR